MFGVSQHQTSAHTRMKQHGLWLSQVMTVALKGMWPYSLRIKRGADGVTLWKEKKQKQIILIMTHEKH